MQLIIICFLFATLQLLSTGSGILTLLFLLPLPLLAKDLTFCAEAQLNKILSCPLYQPEKKNSIDHSRSFLGCLFSYRKFLSSMLD
jgi:hypothetical protein